MVLLHIKQGSESQFHYETSVTTSTSSLIPSLLSIYNCRLKVLRICSQIEELAKHGTHLPPNMLGLTPEQVEELNLTDEFGDICIPSGGFDLVPDPIGRRNGKAPLKKMAQVLLKTVEEAKGKVSAKLVTPMTPSVLKEQLSLLQAACRIVYPMNLPPHDPIRMEFEGKEELGGTHDSLMVISEEEVELWFCGKQIVLGDEGKLMDFIGKNEKSKVILKIQKKGQGPPSREPVLSEEQQKDLMMLAYRRQQEVKKLEEEDDNGEYLESEWADGQALKRQFQGMRNLKWKP